MSDRFTTRGPLDPRVDPARWERRVRSIMGAARPQLDAIAAARPPLPLVALATWFRPVLAGAALVAAIAAATLLSASSEPAAETWGVAELIAPEPVAAWLLVGVLPNAEEVVLALEEEGR